MTNSRVSRQIENQVLKALNRSALVVFIVRALTFLIYSFMHLWGLMGVVFCGAILWLWIYRSTSNGRQNLAFILGIVESGIFCVLSIAALGWNCGAYFSLIVLLPIILINSKLGFGLRISLGIFITVVLMLLFILSRMLGLDALATPFYQNLLFGLNLLQGCGILILITTTVESVKLSSQEEIVLANEQLMTLANTDSLTGLLNRRYMMSEIEAEKINVDRGGMPFTLIMIDVDNFKQINDQYGHDGGDFVLVTLAEKIKFGLRKNDLISRWGGDEFLIMLPEVELATSQFVAEKIRKRILNSPFIFHETDIPVTITLGVSQCDRNTGIGSSLRKADLALYKGKQGGKNRITFIN